MDAPDIVMFIDNGEVLTAAAPWDALVADNDLEHYIGSMKALKKVNGFNGVNPVTVQMPVRNSPPLAA